jgi:glycogen debranching enzyme
MASGAAAAPVSLDRLGVSVKKTPRQFVSTNKEAGTYYSEALAQNSGGWFGWFVNTEKIMHDYELIAGGARVERAGAVVTVYPHQSQRRYKDGTVETFTMADSINALIIEVTGAKKDVDIRILLPDQFTVEPNTVLPYRSWRRVSAEKKSAVPSSIVSVPYRTANGIVFIISASSSLENAMRLADSVFLNKERLIDRRRQRMEAILRRAAIDADDTNLTKAFAWAVLSMDALIMRQAVSGVPTTGIFAGLPWFNNYWGRDSFISLPGATYVTGNFADAKEILRSYARFQELDTTSTNYGRIPNLATPTSVQYNTADGTPWFVKGVDEYVEATGDTAFYREMYPVVLRSVEGTLRYHTDSLNFLTHADAESWMDAVGPDGPWSPRGNRANDIQALWYDQLHAAARIALRVGDREHSSQWMTIARDLSNNFIRTFVDTARGLVYDHLTARGVPSQELRPNQLYCLRLLDDRAGRAVTATVLSRLVYEHGAGTLAQTDSNFTPFHHYEPFYVQDAAYHNGIVWTWLNGAAIHAAARFSLQDVVYPVTKNMVHQILDRGCVGTLSELLDAHVRKGEKEPRLSGTYSQAWSLAEFIRSMYQDYLGARVEGYAKHIQLTPRLPKVITDISFPLTAPEGTFTVRYVRKGPGLTVRITSQAHANYAVGISLLNDDGYEAAMTTKIGAMSTVELKRVNNELIETHDGRIIPSEAPWMNRWITKETPEMHSAPTVHLAVPVLMPYLKLLKGPSYPMLPLSTAGRKNPAASLLFEKDDPSGDDKGPDETYIYPRTNLLKPGSLDIIHAEVRYDKTSVYFALTFKALSDPGWHPEYGFQLTLAAIAIHRAADNTQTIVGVNSNAILPADHAYDRLLIVGGGYRLTDGAGTVLCEYRPRPEDAKHPIGNVNTKTIEFSVPVEYIGSPTKEWKMTVLIGAQDDHGGAGVGEFRAVDARGGEWTGGGKANAAQPNVFDMLVLGY